MHITKYGNFFLYKMTLMTHQSVPGVSSVLLHHMFYASHMVHNYPVLISMGRGSPYPLDVTLGLPGGDVNHPFFQEQFCGCLGKILRKYETPIL